MKYLYLIDHFVPFPQSEYGGLWTVIAENDEECFDLIANEDDNFNSVYYTKLSVNITRAPKYALSGDHESEIVVSFLT